ncbi:hypothetical protein HELRODRAFT_115827 [Helobdella robusta]|uniref:BZIP domain-containing protein n=1 Tax=Helobdella robusta TaxID=6412 RepID=T1EGB0_HELRO|nr:hypothetical protein HELRODRAFT_115827 [Helobdella robusta]ESN92472.1 hypothetical protein HELRODRAFT_115827 [Helobdella robusta]
METTFYDDNNLSVKKMKTNMTLDFNKMKQQTSDLLQTPDVGGLLMMNTPELERLLAYNNFNTVMTTPTPTGQILFPKMVTEEQEAYARGFIDALGELHKKSQVESLPSSTTQTPLRPQTQQHLQPAVRDVKVVPQQQQQPQVIKTNVVEQQQLRATPPSTLAAVTSATSTSAPYLPTTITDMICYNNFADFNISEMSNVDLMQNNPLLQPLKPLVDVKTTATTNNVNTNSKVYFNASASPPQLIENYQTVPHLPTNYSIKNTHSPGSSTSTSSAHHKPPTQSQLQQQQQCSNSISPIDMNMQELAKLERKRERNRHAATLCRNRKLERIARLEDRVKELKDQNMTLAQTANLLRSQVSELKQAIFEHTQMGCQVMLTSKFLDSDVMFS